MLLFSILVSQKGGDWKEMPGGLPPAPPPPEDRGLRVAPHPASLCPSPPVSAPSSALHLVLGLRHHSAFLPFLPRFSPA